MGKNDHLSQREGREQEPARPVALLLPTDRTAAEWATLTRARSKEDRKAAFNAVDSSAESASSSRRRT